ncbi:MAG: hypothetical protein OEY81_02565, partial [Candidatus Bathyarchaeota archaeon]|nr:hypothetical protein [Candidatus Bathyarchaeota archaeon]
MKKALTIIGILFLLIGLVSISRSSVQDIETNTQLVNEKQDQWIISGNYKGGENLSLNFIPHTEWSRPPYPPDGIETPYSKLFTVNITNTAVNSYTLIEVVLALSLPLGVPPSKPYDYFLYVYSEEVTHHGAITIEDYPDKINGIAEDDGLYQVKCSLDPSVVMGDDLLPHPASPPRELTLYSITSEAKYSYNLLLPTGISFCIIGLIASIWGVKTKNHKTTRK